MANRLIDCDPRHGVKAGMPGGEWPGLDDIALALIV
jgi:hypothetical protein